MARKDMATQHSIGRTLLLHLGPGIIMLLLYAAFVPALTRSGFPPIFGSILTIPLILVPWMLGYLAIEGKRITGRYIIRAAISYRERLTLWQYLKYGLPLIIWSIFILLASEAYITPILINRLTEWLPIWFLNPADFEVIISMPFAQLILFLFFYLIFVGLVAPVVEELYFRGNLLPAVSRYGVWAPIFTTALFTLYHFESPWENPARFLVVLPMVLIVWSKRSVSFGIVIHVMLNTLGAIFLAVAALSARGG